MIAVSAVAVLLSGTPEQAALRAGLALQQAQAPLASAVSAGQTAAPSLRLAPGDPARRFRFDERTGACLDAAGVPGLNRIALEQVAAAKDGECADLRGLQLNGDDLAYPRLKGWNLRGADLRDGRLFFAHLEDADLRGADLRGFTFGYASIQGRTDARTRMAPGFCGERAPGEIFCIR